jgi:hypothetical protein
MLRPFSRHVTTISICLHNNEKSDAAGEGDRDGARGDAVGGEENEL